MNTDLWIAAVSAVVALTALGLAAFAVARMSKAAPVKVAIVIIALTGFITAIPLLITAFDPFRV
ncbi:hypothetical protein [Streptomyces sp. NPDC058861]|uniref:hypothetical protein n=1 Tax=Streptomyces sp. NPDC058861 TaxID=3346653 RepID=UPI0036957D28